MRFPTKQRNLMSACYKTKKELIESRNLEDRKKGEQSL